eukprot:172433-Prymnesium_polylepis.1
MILIFLPSLPRMPRMKWTSAADCISNNQWQSVAIGGNRWQSVAVSGNQWQSVRRRLHSTGETANPAWRG